MSSTMPAHHPRRAVAVLLAALLCFAALDTTTQAITSMAPLVMAVWFRYLFQAVSTAAVLLPRRGRALLRTRHPWLQAMRGLMLLTTSLLGFLSLQHMPVGEFTAIVMLTPLAVTLLAAHALGERIGVLRWAVLFGGFAGALLIVRPGRDMLGVAALYPLALVAALAAFQVLTSRLARTDDPGTMHFYTGWIGTLACSVALPWSWRSLDGTAWALLVAAGVLGSLGHFLFIQGYRRAPASTLTPFLYVQIAFATLGGWWVFGHAPDGLTWAGIVVIAVCGAGGTFLASRTKKHTAGP
jgi:drug/metabolite transporter (DMT)-like permease